MAQQTICPACGAPIEYNGQGDQIRCPFCDAELQVVEEGDTTRFQVLSQPGPQKEVLSQPVEPVEGPGRPDLDTTFANFSMGGSTAPETASAPFGGEPSVPPAPDAPFYSPTASSQEVLTTPVGGSGGTPAGRSGVNRWVIIGAVVVLALCTLCACAAIVSLFAVNSNGRGF